MSFSRLKAPIDVRGTRARRPGGFRLEPRLRFVVAVFVAFLLTSGFVVAIPLFGGDHSSGVSGPVKAAAADPVEKNRPHRIVTQTDFVDVEAGAHTYVVEVGAGSKGNLSGLYTVSTPSTVPKYTALGDFNRDSRDDWFDVGGNRLTLNVTLSASTPSTPGAPGTKYNLATFSGRYTTIWGVSSADWNGDGFSDAILAIRREQFGDYQVILFLGTNGTPAGNLYYLTSPFSESPKFIAAGDFNADGRGDFALVVQTGASTYALRVYLSNSTSTCVGCSTYAYTASLTGTPVGLAMGDWDRDGKWDVIVAEQRSTTDYRFKLGFGQKGRPNSPQTLTLTEFSTATALPMYVSAGDWDADGRDDLFAVYQTGTTTFEARVTFSAATPSSRTAAGSTKVAVTFYITYVYAFVVGDWTGDSTRVYYDGFTGSRTFTVPVALLTPPPYEKGITNSASGKAIYSAGTLGSSTYTGSVRVGGSVAFSWGAGVQLPFGIAGLETKVEIELEAGVSVQWGREQSWSKTLSYEVTGDKLDLGSVLVVVDVPYLDYRYQVVNKNTSTVKINVDSFEISLPDPNDANYVMRLVYLSEYNAKKPKDMPAISDSSTHKISDLRSYVADDQYTPGCVETSGCWISATAQASYLGSGNAVFTFTSGVTNGWGWDYKTSARYEITGTLGGISAGYALSGSLGLEYMEEHTYSSSITIGGKAGELWNYDTDIYGAGYEKFGYQYNVYVRRVDYASSGQYPAVSILVLDWKAKNLNEGYPVVPTVTAVAKTTISLSWTLANDYIHSAGYIVHWSTKPSFIPDSNSGQLSRDTTSYTITGLNGGKTYYIKIEGLYTSGYSNFSIVLTVTTPRI